MCKHKNTTIIDDLKYCADCGLEIMETCPTCGKEPLACQCPTINRGSFAKYVDKREEIREVIDHYADDGCLYPNKTCEFFKGSWCVSGDEAYKCLMKRLDGIGVVIKVKCPDCAWGQVQETVGMTPCYSCNSTGYITEPIIEDSK